MNIVFSSENKKQVMVLPIPPREIEIVENQNNSDFLSLAGTIRIIGKSELIKISFSSFFPSKKLSYMSKGATDRPWEYVDFIKNARKKQIPIRVVIMYKSRTINLAMTIDEFSHSVDRAGDIRYSISLTEYKIPTPLKSKVTFWGGI